MRAGLMGAGVLALATAGASPVAAQPATAIGPQERTPRELALLQHRQSLRTLPRVGPFMDVGILVPGDDEPWPAATWGVVARSNPIPTLGFRGRMGLGVAGMVEREGTQKSFLLDGSVVVQPGRAYFGPNLFILHGWHDDLGAPGEGTIVGPGFEVGIFAGKHEHVEFTVGRLQWGKLDGDNWVRYTWGVSIQWPLELPTMPQ